MTQTSTQDLDVPAAGNWMDRAACRGVDLAVFYPSRPGATYDSARRICGGCPVAAACLDYALTAEGSLHWTHRHGIWGGLDPRERYQRWRCTTGRCRHTDHREVA